MMKKNKMILVLLFILSMQFKINVLAWSCLGHEGSGIYCGSKGMPNYLVSSLVYANDTISYYSRANMGIGQVSGRYSAIDTPLFNIKLNGQDALCLDSNKNFPAANTYKKASSSITGSFINKIYNWSLKSPTNKKAAQIIFWAAKERGFFGTQTVNNSITYVSKNWNFMASANAFYEEFKSDFTLLYGGEGTGSELNSNEARFLLPSLPSYRCLYYLLSRIDKKDYDSKSNYCKDRSISSYKMEDTNKDGNLDSIDIYYSVSETSTNLTNYTSEDVEYRSMIFDISNWENYNSNKIKDRIKEEFGSGGYSGIIDDASIESVIKGIYVQIMGESDSGRLAIYKPADDSTGDQWIIAPDEPASKSCSNYLAAFRELGVTDDELMSYSNQIKEATGSGLVRNSETGVVKCANSQQECYSSKVAYIKVKSIYKGHSPKFGSVWRNIYIPKVVPDGSLKCECDIETEKFTKKDSSNSIYGKTCEEFKNWYQNVAKIGPATDIVTCRDSDHFAKCGGTITDDRTCEQEVINWPGSNYTQSDLNTANSRITVGEKAILVNGRITCNPPCDPVVNVDNGRCALKSLSKPWFELKDATTDGNDYKMSCILDNIAYNVNSSIIASKDENFSSSKYCDVYCWESLYASLPTEPAPTSYVESGRLFFWGLNYYKKEFANFEVRRICWSKNINYEQFKTDWNNNEAAIAKAKTAYDNQVAYNAKSGWDSTEACKYDCVSTSSTETVSCGNYNRHGNCGANDCYWDGSCWKRDKSSETCKDGTRYKRGAVGSGDTASSSYDSCLGSAPSESDIDNASEESSRKSNLEGLIKKRQDLKNAIMACQSTQVINENTIYKHTASIELVDNQQLGLCNVRGVCGEKLKLNNIVEDQRIETNTPQTGSFNVSCTDVGAFNSNNPCAVNGGTTIPVYLNNGYEWDYTASESFRYNDFFNFYAQADTNFVANKDYKVEKFNYTNAIAYGLTYDLGKGIPAYIGKYRGQFDLEVNISGLGNDGHFDTIAQNGDKYGYDFSKYSCPYDLEVIIYDNEKDNCPPSNPDYPCLGGIAVVYRIIEMASGNKAKIFPGINAKDGGRAPGSNWAEFINNYQNKFKNITTTSYVYDRKPLYSIELSPTLIGEIRRNNNSYRDENMDPYTSYKDPKGNYKIKCTSGNDKSCTSSYITDLILRGKITGQFAESNDEDRRNLIMRYKTEGRL